MEVDCKVIALAGMSGLISKDACLEVYNSLDFKILCGCATGSRAKDAQSAIKALSSFTQAEKPNLSVLERFLTAESFRPRPAQKPMEYNPSTTSSVDTTVIPSTVPAVDNGEGNDDVSWSQSSILPISTPSNRPSENPSAVPSSFPSDAPSDTPSAQPNADNGLSGIVAESSANKILLGLIVQMLPTMLVLAIGPLS